MNPLGILLECPGVWPGARHSMVGFLDEGCCLLSILVLPGSKPLRLRTYYMVADLLPFVKPYFENIPNQKKSPRPEPGALTI